LTIAWHLHVIRPACLPVLRVLLALDLIMTMISRSSHTAAQAQRRGSWGSELACSTPVEEGGWAVSCASIGIRTQMQVSLPEPRAPLLKPNSSCTCFLLPVSGPMIIGVWRYKTTTQASTKTTKRSKAGSRASADERRRAYKMAVRVQNGRASFPCHETCGRVAGGATASCVWTGSEQAPLFPTSGKPVLRARPPREQTRKKGRNPSPAQLQAL
jgi:hypothetical protein